MTVFVFPSIKELTDHWHTSGGAVVVANTLEDAVFELTSHGAVVTKEEEENAIGYETGDVDKNVFIFPDAGCC